jgi:hypothetical protein
MEEATQLNAMKHRARIANDEEMLMKGMLNVQIEKKDPMAWANVKKIGRLISKKWKLKEPSWQLISESRR